MGVGGASGAFFLYIWSTSTLRPEEGFAIPLNLAQGRLCCSHTSFGVLAVTTSMWTMHIHFGLHLLSTDGGLWAPSHSAGVSAGLTLYGPCVGSHSYCVTSRVQWSCYVQKTRFPSCLPQPPSLTFFPLYSSPWSFSVDGSWGAI